MKRKSILLTLTVTSLIIACTNTNNKTNNKVSQDIEEPTNQVVLSSEIEWEMLNPARGDQSPKAGTIWGDRNGTEATGFLVKFADGFSSPPHIHNVTYRAMVIKGQIHNDDPVAEKMWMPAGSFWTQPAGEVHITAAKGSENMAYVEIDKAPYLVKPIEEAFDNGERPVNVDKSNIVWLDASKTSIIDNATVQNFDHSPKVAFLWQNNELQGNLVKLPSKFKGEISSKGKAFHAVIIAGELKYIMPKTNESKSLDPGSYFRSSGQAIHQISTKDGSESIIYIRTTGTFKVSQSK